MSRERARAREARAAEAARRAAETADRQARARAERLRRERRALAWRRVRLWQHGPAFRRHKERWAALATLAMVAILLAYLLTGSLQVVLLVVLVLMIAGPALVMLTFDRRHR